MEFPERETGRGERVVLIPFRASDGNPNGAGRLRSSDYDLNIFADILHGFINIGAIVGVNTTMEMFEVHASSWETNERKFY